MSYKLLFVSSRLRAACKKPIGGGVLLLLTFACSPAFGKEPWEANIAFASGVEKATTSQAVAEQPAPLPPQPTSTSSQSSAAAAKGVETLPSGSYSTPEPQPYEMPMVEYSYVDNGFSHWPVIGPLKRHWITITKPHLQASHWGYPEYFVERPFGSYVIQAEQMQIVNGLRDQQVLYDYDFLPGDRADTLSPRGEYQLRKMIRRMECVPSPIIIQTTVDNPKLDDARKQNVLAAMQSAGVPATPELVVVDRPPVPGLQGVEGVLIYNNLLGQTQARGGGFSLGTGDSGSNGNVNIGNVNFAGQQQ